MNEAINGLFKPIRRARKRSHPSWAAESRIVHQLEVIPSGTMKTLASLEPPLFEALHSPTVKIMVGKPATEFGIQQDILVHYSSYFRAALTGDFQEAHTREILLETESATVFKAFVNFVYHQELCKPKEIKAGSMTGDDATDVALSKQELIDIWVFGDRRGIPALQNKTINVLHRQTHQT